MEDFLIDMGLATLIGVLKRKIPNDPNAKGRWKKAFLKLFLAIRDAYGDDPQFKLNK